MYEITGFENDYVFNEIKFDFTHKFHFKKIINFMKTHTKQLKVVFCILPNEIFENESSLFLIKNVDSLNIKEKPFSNDTI